MTTRQCLGLVAAVLGLAATCAGCGHDPTTPFPPGPHVAPTRARDCDDLPALGGDPGIVLGTDWSGEHHDYGDTVVVHACLSTSLGGHLALVADEPGIQIRPRAVPVDPSGNGIIPFLVSVSTGAAGEVRITLRSGGSEDDLPGPVVAADDDGWHFVPHER